MPRRPGGSISEEQHRHPLPLPRSAVPNLLPPQREPPFLSFLSFLLLLAGAGSSQQTNQGLQGWRNGHPATPGSSTHALGTPWPRCLSEGHDGAAPGGQRGCGGARARLELCKHAVASDANYLFTSPQI